MNLRIIYSIVSIFFLSIPAGYRAQVTPLNSPYYAIGQYEVLTETLSDAAPALLTYRPSSSVDGPFPVLLFQPGANGFFEDNINVHTYDLYMQHLASYGYVVVVIDNTDGGPNDNLFSGVYNRLVTFSNNASHWMNSTADLSKLIIGGHSNGGMNATKLLIQQPQNVMGIIYMASYPNPGTFGFGADDVSSYSGNVLFLMGDEDATSVPLSGSTNEVAFTAYSEGYSSANCKSWVLFNGVGHGGFGDYTHDSHTVGTIGREPVTASVRHYLVSFMERTTKESALADQQFQLSTNRLTSVGEFQTSCTLIDDEPNTASVVQNEITFTCYPNPSDDFLEVEFMNQSVLVSAHLLDGLGRDVPVDFAGNTIQLGNIPAGTYYLSVNNMNEYVRIVKN
jgi:hypothetical protein